jgi:hypothetical protein
MAGSVQFCPGLEMHFELAAGIVSRFWFYVTASGAPAEFAVTENEGAMGIASFLVGERTPSQAAVRV